MTALAQCSIAAAPMRVGTPMPPKSDGRSTEFHLEALQSRLASHDPAGIVTRSLGSRDDLAAIVIERREPLPGRFARFLQDRVALGKASMKPRRKICADVVDRLKGKGHGVDGRAVVHGGRLLLFVGVRPQRPASARGRRSP
jgi:hypothetical protein